jgi:hypothetical protein
MFSLIQIARIAEDLAFQAVAAKLLAPFAPEASAAHLKNVQTLYVQLGEALSPADVKKAG